MPRLYPGLCQHEANLGRLELVEPVVARLGVILEFEFAGSYEVRNYGSKTVEELNAISVIWPQGWQRSRLIIRGHDESLVIMFQTCDFHSVFGVPTAPLLNAGTEGHALWAARSRVLISGLGVSAPLHKEYNFWMSTSFSNWQPSILRILCIRRCIFDRGRRECFRGGSNDGCQPSSALSEGRLTTRELPRRPSPPFQHLITLSSRTKASLTWTQIAHAVQYHDHMQMIRDFRDFAGEAPTSALQEITPEHLSTSRRTGRPVAPDFRAYLSEQPVVCDVAPGGA